ncbi:ATP-binding protein [Sorangium sp. So ce1504]|uniref:AAA family ATPase n=1 Tax=Sorangium sp. So ce1504 TaxID=3133337 RepID=UPI003F605AE4
MIHTFYARNYGCLVDTEASLTPLHAFIGPNDSGKSTLLHGMRTLVQLAGSHFQQDKGRWRPFEPYLLMTYPSSQPPRKPHDILLECGVDGGWFAIEMGPRGLQERAGERRISDMSAGHDRSNVPRLWETRSVLWRSKRPSEQQILTQLRQVRLVRFDPDALRAPSGLIPETQPVGFLDDRGHGLAGIYFAIRNRNDDAFSRIVDDVRRHFPTIKGLRVKVVTSSEVVLEVELVNGARVEAARLSEGLLYYLAFAALRYMDPVSLLLVEEPENGLHPARIAEVMRILRAIVEESGTQVLMATHSPLVVNELKPDEVSVVTRTAEEGTRVKRIKDTPDFEERSKVYALGELWIAYANGEDEAPLLEAPSLDPRHSRR